MARFRWLSTFTLLGILLLILGIVGKVYGPRFIYDPGQVPDGNEAWAYIAVGLLMLVNGLLSPTMPESDRAEPLRSPRTRISPVPAAPTAVSSLNDPGTE